jgi:hypothetical protein
MDTRPKPQKNTPVKPPTQRGQAKDKEQLWLRWFSLALIAGALISALTVYYTTRSSGFELQEDTYVSVQIKTLLGTEKVIVCRLSLLIDPDQESDLQDRKKLLETVASQALVDLYQRAQRPEMAEVRQDLLLAINQKLPRKLQIREVLIQELSVGFR